jgi:hypothetical protein
VKSYEVYEHAGQELEEELVVYEVLMLVRRLGFAEDCLGSETGMHSVTMLEYFETDSSSSISIYFWRWRRTHNLLII